MTSRTTMWIGVVVVMAAEAVSMAGSASADADDPAVYEVVSNAVSVVDVTFFDGEDYQHAEHVSLPWSTEARVGDLSGNGRAGNLGEVRAHWSVEPGKQGSVTSRIRYQGKVLIENTRDNGEVGCSASTFSLHWG